MFAPELNENKTKRRGFTVLLLVFKIRRIVDHTFMKILARDRLSAIKEAVLNLDSIKSTQFNATRSMKWTVAADVNRVSVNRPGKRLHFSLARSHSSAEKSKHLSLPTYIWKIFDHHRLASFFQWKSTIISNVNIIFIWITLIFFFLFSRRFSRWPQNTYFAGLRLLPINVKHWRNTGFFFSTSWFFTRNVLPLFDMLKV